MKLYSYVVKNDTGFAPNPFHGYCTLAVCTPNHMGIKVKVGDWLLGTTTKKRGYRLIYVMRVDEILGFGEYYHDRRFEKKKPVPSSSGDRRYGDNIYYKDATGLWKQVDGAFHCEPDEMAKDLKHPKVFISKTFYYFGSDATVIPTEYSSLIWPNQGVKGDHDPRVVAGFLTWLQRSFETGIHGRPFDR